MGIRLTQPHSWVITEEHFADARYKRQIPAQNILPGFDVLISFSY